jgi:hypothetical protein
MFLNTEKFKEENQKLVIFSSLDFTLPLEKRKYSQTYTKEN